jgi:hypothetical protein
MVLKLGHLESSEMWWCRRMEKISWSDHVRNEEELHRINEDRFPINNKKKGW